MLGAPSWVAHKKDVGSLLAGKLRPHVEEDLVGGITYSADLGAEEREPVQDQGREGHEVRFLDVGLFLDCFQGGFLHLQVGSLQV